MTKFIRNRSLAAKLEHHLIRVESMIAGISLAAILLLSLVQIGLRNFFHTGIPNADVVIQHLVLWVSFFGAVLAVRERHIKIDVAVLWMPESWRNWLERPIFAFCAIVCAALCWAAVRYWYGEWTSAGDAKWVTAMAIILPLSFGLLTLHFLLRALIGPRAADRPA